MCPNTKNEQRKSRGMGMGKGKGGETDVLVEIMCAGINEEGAMRIASLANTF